MPVIKGHSIDAGTCSKCGASRIAIEDDLVGSCPERLSSRFLCVATLNFTQLAMCEIIEAVDQVEAERFAMDKLSARSFPFVYELYVSSTPTQIVYDTHQPNGRRIRSMRVSS